MAAKEVRKVLKILEKVHDVEYCSFCEEPLLEGDDRSVCENCGNIFCSECAEHEMSHTTGGRLLCNYCIEREKVNP